MSRTNVNSNVVQLGPLFQSLDNGPLIAAPDAFSQRIVEFRVSSVIPGFGARVKSNKKVPLGLTPNAFHYLKDVTKYGHGTFLEYNELMPSQNVFHTGYMLSTHNPSDGGPVLAPSGSDQSRLLSQINAKLLDKLKDQRVNLAQVYAERKLTADLIADAAISIAKCFSYLKKGNFVAAARSLGVQASRRKTARFNRVLKSQGVRKASADGFLSLQYGWRPLLQDIYGSAEFLAKKQGREIRSRVSAKSTWKDNVNTVVKASPYYYDVYTKADARFEYSAHCLFSTSGAELSTAKEAGLTNPAALAWELTPFSFVVDWFLPVGNFLSSLDATLGLHFESGSYTTFHECRSSVRLSAYQLLGVSHVYGRSRYTVRISSTRNYVENFRTVMLSFPSNEIPSFKNPFSFEHAANAIALLQQVFKE
jgi:hypothetical protein